MNKNVKESQLVSNFARWTIIVSSSIIALTLTVSWILWMTVYKETITKALAFFGDKTIAQGYGINLTFLIFSIIILIFVLLMLVSILPLVFFRKKSGFMVFTYLFNFILSVIIIVSLLLFVITSYSFYNDFYQVYGWNKIIITFLPWLIIGVVDLFFIFSSLWNLINVANGVNFIPVIEEQEIETNQEGNDLPSEQQVNASHSEDSSQPESIKDISSKVISDDVKENDTKTNQKVESTSKQSHFSTSNRPSAFAIFKQNEKGDYVLLQENNSHSDKLVNNSIANAEPILNIQEEIQKLLSSLTKEQIEEVWNKGHIIAGVNPKLYRKDYAGAWMFHDAFTKNLAENNIRSYAWTIVFHRPVSQNGDNTVKNLDPMNVTNAITKGQDYPKWKTKVSSAGNENVIKEQTWKAKF